jgi:hypothetical protein
VTDHCRALGANVVHAAEGYVPGAHSMSPKAAKSPFVAIMDAEILPQGPIRGALEVFATDSHGEDFLIHEHRVKAAAPPRGRAMEDVIVLVYQTE